MFTVEGAKAAAKSLIEGSYIGLGTGTTLGATTEVPMGTSTNYERVKCHWSTNTSNTDTEANIQLDTSYGTGGVSEGVDPVTGLPYIIVQLRNYNTFMFNDADNPAASQGDIVWGVITVIYLFSGASVSGSDKLYEGQLTSGGQTTSITVHQGDRPRFSADNNAFTIQLKFQQV